MCKDYIPARHEIFVKYPLLPKYLEGKHCPLFECLRPSDALSPQCRLGAALPMAHQSFAASLNERGNEPPCLPLSQHSIARLRLDCLSLGRSQPAKTVPPSRVGDDMSRVSCPSRCPTVACPAADPAAIRVQSSLGAVRGSGLNCHGDCQWQRGRAERPPGPSPKAAGCHWTNGRSQPPTAAAAASVQTLEARLSELCLLGPTSVLALALPPARVRAGISGNMSS